MYLNQHLTPGIKLYSSYYIVAIVLLAIKSLLTLTPLIIKAMPFHKEIANQPHKNTQISTITILTPLRLVYYLQ